MSVYPATNSNEAVELVIDAANQMHQVINGAANETVTTESGDIPSVRKAIADSLVFLEPLPWKQGDSETNFLQIRSFNNELYWAPSATIDTPKPMGFSPLGDTNWKLAPLRLSKSSILVVLGKVNKGFWDENPTLINEDDFVVERNTGDCFGAITTPYLVDSSTNPNPSALLPNPDTGSSGELFDASKFISAENINNYTDIVYKSSGSNSAVENMINGVPLSVKIGGTCSTGGTTWLRNGGDGSSLSDYTPQGVVYVSDFKLSTGDSAGLQEVLDLSGDIVVPHLTNIIIDDQCNVKSNTRLTIDGSITTTKHGYDALVCDAVSDVEISGNGFISGIGLFPEKTLNGQSGAGEKGYCLAERNKWPLSRGNVDNGLGSFQGGFIGNGGCGVLIKNGCENVEVNIETKGFSYAGVCVGDPLLTGTAGEVRNKNITIDGEHHDNYDAGVSWHAVDGLVIKDSCRTYNNGHPDAVESDNEINPGYGVTSRLTADGAESAKDVYLGGRHTFNKRKNVDAHSGQDIRVDAYSEGAMVYGAQFGGNSGSRGRVMGQIISINNGYATGAVVDRKAHLAISGDYDSTRLKLISRGGAGSMPFSINRVERIKLEVDCIGGTGNVKPVSPFSVVATSVNPASIELSGVIAGTYSAGAHVAWCSGSVQSLDMSDCVYDAVGQSIIMDNCDIDFGEGNKFPHPQFNISNKGAMSGARTLIQLTYNGNDKPSEKYLRGGSNVSQYYAGAKGAEFVSIADSFAAGSNGVHNAQVTFKTPRVVDVQYTVAEDVSANDKQAIAIGQYRANNTLVGNATINNMQVYVDIEWGFQK